MPVDAPPQHLTQRTVRIVASQAPEGSASAAWRRQIVTFEVRNPAADWLRDAISEVEALTKLPADWNTYGSRPIAASAATQAVGFLVDNAYAELARPAVVPLADGGVQLEWHRGGIDLEIAFSPVDPGVYFEDTRSGETAEASLSDARSFVLSSLSRLAV
jgi:hypothetical protein